MTIRRPMLACTGTIEMLSPGFIVSPKLDGVRALVTKEGLMSRTMKPIRNEYLQDFFAKPEYIGFDGELILGDPTDPDVYRKTVSAVNSIKHGQAMNIVFHVFDDFSDMAQPFINRYGAVMDRTAKLAQTANVHPLLHRVGSSVKDFPELEKMYLDEGYEGMIARSPMALYKQGRSTANERGLLKLKHFIDAEALVVRLIEQLHNDNPAQVNELGLTSRSSAQDNMVPAGTLGAIEVKDLASGRLFCIGSGFTNEQRQYYWDNPKEIKGKVITYKCFPNGVKDKPRFPTFKGVRPMS